jgi:non-specific serine/threonine protein kinase
MDAETRSSFGSLLKSYRLARGLSQEALAERSGLSREAISLLERGLRLSPQRDTVGLLAKTLNLSADERTEMLAAMPARRWRPAAATRAEASPPPSLPLRLTSFIGREQEIAGVRELLLSTRLLTLSGPGGIGKTSLALEVVAAVRTQFAGGVALVELAALTDGALVPQAIAAVLAVREQPGQPLLTTLITTLGATQRLLVLDNCEHLVEACARVVETLLQSCPRLHILATGREPLRVGAEVIWRVPPLTLPPDHPQPLAALAGSEAVRLFVERAAAVRAGFGLAPANAAAVAEICRRLDGIPLAIELAAARVSALTPAQIAQHLHERFRLLTMGSRTAVPRHQTLRALLDWSHDLLSADEKILFSRLAVFVGGWTLEAAEAVCGFEGVGGQEPEPGDCPPTALPAVLDLLTTLVDKSLVQVEERDGEARFTMLETIRAYARDQLMSSGEASNLYPRHARWALALAETARPDMWTEEKLRVWLARLGQEEDNLRAALRWLREAGDVERALRLVATLWLSWVIRDDYAEGKAQIEAALALPGVVDFPAALAAVRRGAGHVAYFQGNLPAARAHLEAAVAYYRGSGDQWKLGDSLNWLGAVAREQGDFARAIPWLEEALAVVRGVGDPDLTGFALFHLGIARHVQGDLIRSRALLEESVAVCRGGGLTELRVTQALASLGVVVEDLGDDARARSLYREAMAYMARVEDRGNTAALLVSFASLAVKAGHPDRALRLIGGADRLCEEIGSPFGLVSSRQHSRTLALARRLLAPEVADAEVAAGRHMTLQEAVAYALAERDREAPV